MMIDRSLNTIIKLLVAVILIGIVFGRGFDPVELLVVLLIIAIVASVF